MLQGKGKRKIGDIRDEEIEEIDLTHSSDGENGYKVVRRTAPATNGGPDRSASHARNQVPTNVAPSQNSQTSYLQPPSIGYSNPSHHTPSSSTPRSVPWDQKLPSYAARPDPILSARSRSPAPYSRSATLDASFSNINHLEIDLTQDDDDEVSTNYELFGIYKTKIVGTRFYNGHAGVGEFVVVKREPTNHYDTNAIQVNNVMGTQIGHLGKEDARKLAPLMDNRSLLVEGALTGVKGEFTWPISLKLFGSADAEVAECLKHELMSLRLPVGEYVKAEAARKKRQKEQAKAHERAQREADRVSDDMFRSLFHAGEVRPGGYALTNVPGSGLVPSNTLQDILASAQSFTPRAAQHVVDTLGSREEVLCRLPSADQPDKLSTQLLPYQRQGVKWMQQKESCQLPPVGSKEIVQLWTRDGVGFTNIATNCFSVNDPVLAQGGILADDMGLGKTIQVISLIMSNLDPAKQPTLIVAPLSVMSNWTTQIEKHVKAAFQPQVLVFHGPDRINLTARTAAHYDVIVTTYHTLLYELFPSGRKEPVSLPTKSGLLSTPWRRVILDEGHQIRNPNAKMTKAACALKADSRWLLTGTPIVNTLKDLYSHVHFLRLTGGLERLDVFTSKVMRPMKNNDPDATKLLQGLMSTLCLRRMKEMKFVDLKLPEIEFRNCSIEFRKHERKRYDLLRDEAQGLVSRMLQSRNNRETYAHLLEILLRMRQCCNYWKLCGKARTKRMLDLLEANEMVDVENQANRQALQDILQLRIDSQDDCPICMDQFRSPVITACAHAFCSGCIEQVIRGQAKCPMCRKELKSVDKLVPPAAGIGEGHAGQIEDGDEDTLDEDGSSSKIQFLLKILEASERTPDTKTIVFSQWTSFLDVLEPHLQGLGLRYTRLDGKMNAAARDRAIAALDTEPDCKIMLASLSVCSVGLNLVSANQVILSDSWWAPAIEDQAINRVHRLGQRRKCNIMRLVMQDSIEDRVLEIQKAKRELMSQAFGEEPAGARDQGGATVRRLRDIEQMLR